MDNGRTDVKQDVNTSAEQTGTSYTEEQVKVREVKARSDALADVNRLKVEADKTLKAAQAAQERVNRMIKEQEEFEEERYAEEPERLTEIRKRRSDKEVKAELAKLQSELNERNEQLKQRDVEKAELTKEQNVREIAMRLGVSAAKLARLAKFTDGSTEAIEDIANDLPKVSADELFVADSGRTRGGGGGLTVEVISKMSPEERFARADEIAKISMGYKSLV